MHDNKTIVNILRELADNDQLDKTVSLPVEFVQIIRHGAQEAAFNDIALSTVLKYIADMAE